MRLLSRTSPPYSPEPQQHTVLRLGLHPLPIANWLAVDADFETFYQHKKLLGDSRRAKVYQALPSSAAAAKEFSEFLLAHLLSQHAADYSRNEETLTFSPAKIEFDVSARTLWDSSLWIQEDICLMEELNGEYILSAASLCSPTNWHLEEKIGQSVDLIHDPVPGYEAELGERVNRLLKGLKSNKPVMRYNWSIQHNNELYWRDDSADEEEGFFWRVERQTLLRLPQTGAIVFGIRIFIHSFETMSKQGEFKSSLDAILNRLSKDTLSYKGLNRYLMSLS